MLRQVVDTFLDVPPGIALPTVAAPLLGEAALFARHRRARDAC